MHEQLWITEFLNHYFSGIVTSALLTLRIHPNDPLNPISDAVAMQFVVAVLLLVFFVAIRRSLSVDKPGALQHVAEMLNELIAGQAHDIIGHQGAQFIPYLSTLGLFILSCNLIGLIPGFKSPTQIPSVPLGCALTTFAYYHFHGIRFQGAWTYLKHFAGPEPKIAFMMFPIEIISHLARIMSLTIRLYANMYAGELVTLAFASLIPILLPAGFLAFHIFVSLIQTVIFVLLTAIYITGAMQEEH